VVFQLSVKVGESFERAIAYIMAAAGFVIKEQPHDVKVAGEKVGDLDVLAYDPKSDSTIAVSCKEWKDQPPHTKDFNHMKELMDIENIKFGIVAWTNVPAGVYPLIQIAEKKGYRFTVLDLNRYEELHNHMLAGERDRIEEFFRSGLGLAATKTPTLGQEVSIRRVPTQKRILHCQNLLPLHYGLDPPSYIRNAYFRASEARLEVTPYLLTIFHAHKEARVPGTGELLDSINMEIGAICNAVTGRQLKQEDQISSVVKEHYGEALKDGVISEDNFTAEIHESKINRQEMTYKLRVDAAKSIEPLEVSWTTHRGEEEEEHTRTIELGPNDLRELQSAIVNVPIWNVSYRLMSYTYIREYFATTGETIRDDLAFCLTCKNQTTAVCTSCGIASCAEHIRACKTCTQLFCYDDSLRCVNCGSVFCKSDAKGIPCITCGGFVCSDDDVRCITCNSTICNDHKIACIQCGKTVCEKHEIAARYVAVKKKFCSENCHLEFDLEYKKEGVFGKLGKVAKRHKD
jgi:hypothetical protein